MKWKIPNTIGTSPNPRGLHKAVRFGTKIIFYGGANAKSIFSDVWVFNTHNHEWSNPLTSGQEPPKRLGFSCNLMFGDLLTIFGGADGKENI
jgi:hypothetical protein